MNLIETELVTDPLFKKLKNLKKILMKFGNKTFTLREDTNDENYDIQIKIQICNVFSYLMDMR